MYPVIIAIHGRGNKIPSDQLRYQWQHALNQGFFRYHQMGLHPNIDFEMAYYADHFYQQPLSLEKVTTKKITHIYAVNPLNPSKKTQKQLRSTISKTSRFAQLLDWLEDKFSVFSIIAKPVLKSLLPDVYHYFHNKDYQHAVEQPLKTLIAQYQHRPIILLSHSLGTVIAYNVLHQLSRQSTPPQISTWFTLGSPLGLTSVKGFLPTLSHQKNVKSLATPDCVTDHWINVSDKSDLVCFDPDLQDDFIANRYNVTPQDCYINNQYPGDPHKSYGYLWSEIIAKYGLKELTP